MKNQNDKLNKLFRAYFRARGKDLSRHCEMAQFDMKESCEMDSKQYELIRQKDLKETISCPPDEDLSSYINGTIENGMIKKHIESCPKCRKKAKAAIEAIEASESLQEDIPCDWSFDISKLNVRQKDQEEKK